MGGTGASIIYGADKTVHPRSHRTRFAHCDGDRNERNEADGDDAAGNGSGCGNASRAAQTGGRSEELFSDCQGVANVELASTGRGGRRVASGVDLFNAQVGGMR